MLCHLPSDQAKMIAGPRKTIKTRPTTVCTYLAVDLCALAAEIEILYNTGSQSTQAGGAPHLPLPSEHFLQFNRDAIF